MDSCLIVLLLNCNPLCFQGKMQLEKYLVEIGIG